MKLIQARQRVQHGGLILKGHIWSSGYVVGKNGIDIEDAFIYIRLPWATRWEYCPWTDEIQPATVAYLYRRSKGWEEQLDFGDYR